MLVNFQHQAHGAFLVEDHQDILFYYLPSSAHQDSCPYRAALEMAVGWIKGDALEAGIAPSFEDLERFTNVSHWGMQGIGELDAFEEVNQDKRWPESTDAQERSLS